MAKYKYEVYEVKKMYYTVETDEKTYIKTDGMGNHLVDVYSFNENDGTFTLEPVKTIREMINSGGKLYWKWEDEYYRISEIIDADTGGGYM